MKNRPLSKLQKKLFARNCPRDRGNHATSAILVGFNVSAIQRTNTAPSFDELK